jgi:hypothetical protein
MIVNFCIYLMYRCWNKRFERISEPCGFSERGGFIRYLLDSQLVMNTFFNGGSGGVGPLPPHSRGF